MLRKWLKNSVFFALIISVTTGFSQDTDTLKIFTKTVLSELKSFSSITIQVDSSNFSSLDELLEQSSPIYLKNYGQGQLATLSIRGNGASQTQFFWNGFKMNSPTLGQSDLSLIPSFFINSASLNYSGGSSVNGSGGIGGSLDLSNQLFWKTGLHGSYGKQIGSFTNSTSTYGLSFGNKKVFQQIKFLTRKGENNFEYIDISKLDKPLVNQINNSLNQLGAQYEIGAKINDKNLLQGLVLFFDSRRELPPVIGAVSNSEIQNDKSLKSFLTWKSFQKNFSSDLRVSYFKEKLNYIDSISSIYSEVDIDTYQAQFRTKFSLLKKFDIETSLQNSLSKVNSTGFSDRKQRNEAGLYVKASQKLKKIYYEFYGRQEMIDANFSPLVFGGGFVFPLLRENYLLKGNISSNYRVPTLNDIYWAQGGNEMLLPEKGWSGEIGLKTGKNKTTGKGYITLSERRLNYGVVVFINQTKNWIQWVPTDLGYWSPTNVKQIENKGVEVQAHFLVKKSKYRIQAKTFYTYTHSRNKDFNIQHDERANRIPIYIPTHKANALLSYSRNKFTVFYSQIYNGKVFIDESNSAYLPHYFPANAGINYKNSLNHLNYQLGFRVNNIYNEPYQVVANRPVPGRNYILKLSLSF